jgi:predicted helicase
LITFEQILQKYREISFSERDKGYRFERLMQSYLMVDPYYVGQFSAVWLWHEFPSRADFSAGDKDLGIDLVAYTTNGEYWAIQCKCYQEDVSIDKPKVDTFLSTSGKSFNPIKSAAESPHSPIERDWNSPDFDHKEAGKRINFTYRLWIDTTKKGFNPAAEATIQGQTCLLVDWVFMTFSMPLLIGKTLTKVKKPLLKNMTQNLISRPLLMMFMIT